MKKEQASQLYLLVNDKSNMDALKFYVDLRIEFLKEALTKVDTIDELRRTQGAIDELKRLKSIRDEVNNPRD